MHYFLRYVRQNRKKLIKGALIIAFLILMLQLLNHFIKNNSEDNMTAIDIYNTSNGTIVSDKSAVSGGKLSVTELENVSNKISEFVDLCNNRRVEEAYNLVSNECKEELYQSMDDFVNNYYNALFSDGSREYTIENWTKDTYIVKFTEDLLATGKSINENSYSDYITIVDENGEKKLNINKFIDKEEINKTGENDNIKVEVLSRLKYFDYEIYELNVTNDTDNEILLDQLLDTETIYLKDNKDNRHYSYSNEIIKDDLRIFSGFTKRLKIKFDSPYITGRKINKLYFSEIVLNYDPNNYGSITTTNVFVNI